MTTRPLKTITLWQPWASLITEGRKGIETRSWPTRHRGRIGIHAARREPRDYRGPFMLARTGAMFRDHADPHYQLLGAAAGGGSLDLPLGVMIGAARLVDCVPTEQVRFTDNPDALGRRWIKVMSVADPDKLDHVEAHPDERQVGNFNPGRFAWLLNDVVKVAPLRARGAQSLWSFFCPAAKDYELDRCGDHSCVWCAR